MKHRFVEAFESAWSRPTPERLIALLDPDVVLLQPHLPPIRGRDAALKEFRRLLTWLPAL
jgi:SnoaL-like protein